MGTFLRTGTSDVPAVPRRELVIRPDAEDFAMPSAIGLGFTGFVGFGSAASPHVGSIVHYVESAAGPHLPAVVTQVVAATGLVNLQVFPNAAGPCRFIERVAYSLELGPRTWHWPEA